MEDEADRIVGLYRRHARTWAEDRGTTLTEGAWLDRFLALLPGRGSVLDIGCGSGEPIGRYVVGRGHAVTGVDSSPELISMCEERLPDQDWRVADMRTLSLGRAFDGVLAWDSPFHLRHEDQRRMFPVFRAHAAPRAALMFTSGPAHEVAIGSYRGRAPLPRQPGRGGIPRAPGDERLRRRVARRRRPRVRRPHGLAHAARLNRLSIRSGGGTARHATAPSDPERRFHGAWCERHSRFKPSSGGRWVRCGVVLARTVSVGPEAHRRRAALPVPVPDGEESQPSRISGSRS